MTEPALQRLAQTLRRPHDWQQRCLQVLERYRADGDALTLGRIDAGLVRCGIVAAA